MDYIFEKIGVNEIDQIRELYYGVFTAKPWEDDWSDLNQLKLYINDLASQKNSLTFGLYEGTELIGASLGSIRHWFPGTEYHIDELFIRQDKQGKGAGTFFLEQIMAALKEQNITSIYLLTGRNVPAYDFYLKNGFTELTDMTSFGKKIH